MLCIVPAVSWVEQHAIGNKWPVFARDLGMDVAGERSLLQPECGVYVHVLVCLSWKPSNDLLALEAGGRKSVYDCVSLCLTMALCSKKHLEEGLGKSERN